VCYRDAPSTDSVVRSAFTTCLEGRLFFSILWLLSIGRSSVFVYGSLGFLRAVYIASITGSSQ